jgi:hypothetical protein
MTTEDAINDIESLDFAVRLNLASGLKRFIQLLRNEPSVKLLINVINKDTSLKTAVLKRVKDLSGRDFDERYENPSDTAVAAYVWLLGLMDPEAWKSAAAIAASMPQTWWARKTSRFISQTDSSSISAARSSLEVFQGTPLQQFVKTSPGTSKANTESLWSRDFILDNQASTLVLFTIPPKSTVSKRTVVVKR